MSEQTKRTYVIVGGNGLTQFDDDGKPHHYRVGDTIEMTDADARGQAKFVRLVGALAEPDVDPAPVDEDDEQF